MPTKKSPRKGSLQYWPRKRAAKLLPSVNWKPISSNKAINGFICYKAGMASAYVKDNTPNSLTKGKKIVIPLTILECPTIKIFSTRFYKNGILVKEILGKNLDKELKKRLKIPKKESISLDKIPIDSYDDVRVIVYSQVKKTGIKKIPDLIEISLNGSLEDKMVFIKEKSGKELNASDFFEQGQLIDVRGLTKGKGFSGPVKRFGLKLKRKKSEKGQRRPGNVGPWHPARVTFRIPMAGQLGMFTRIVYNNKILEIGKQKKFSNLKKYGNINTEYILVKGSVQGPVKRQLLITTALRPTKKQLKKDYELLEII